MCGAAYRLHTVYYQKLAPKCFCHIALIRIQTHRSVINVEMRFLQTLSMVSLRVGETKESFLEEITAAS